MASASSCEAAVCVPEANIPMEAGEMAQQPGALVAGAEDPG